LRYTSNVRTFKNKWFTRFAEKEKISDDELRDIVDALEAGQIDAGLGGGVFKQRAARQGGGSSGAYRVIVFFKSGKRSFFVYGFAKSDMANINEKQLKDFKAAAKTAFSYTEEQLDKLVKTNWFVEI
jgi:hypothetical protein